MPRVRIINGKGDPAADPPTGADDADLQGHHDLIESGGVVKPEDDRALVEQRATPGMGVIVNPGVIYVENSSWTPTSLEPKFYEIVQDEEVDVPISSNASGQTRIDLICQKVDKVTEPDDTASNVCPIVVVEGDPGAGAPDVPDDHEALAEVEVADGATAIVNADITDVRREVAFSNTGSSLSVDSIAPTTTSSVPNSTWTNVTDGDITINPSSPSKVIFNGNIVARVSNSAGSIDIRILKNGTTDIAYSLHRNPGTDKLVPIPLIGIDENVSGSTTYQLQYSNQLGGGYTVHIEGAPNTKNPCYHCERMIYTTS